VRGFLYINPELGNRGETRNMRNRIGACSGRRTWSGIQASPEIGHGGGGT